MRDCDEISSVDITIRGCRSQPTSANALVCNIKNIHTSEKLKKEPDGSGFVQDDSGLIHKAGGLKLSQSPHLNPVLNTLLSPPSSKPNDAISIGRMALIFSLDFQRG